MAMPGAVWNNGVSDVMWKYDHLSPKHSGCWFDQETYRGEVVEPGHWCVQHTGQRKVRVLRCSIAHQVMILSRCKYLFSHARARML